MATSPWVSALGSPHSPSFTQSPSLLPDYRALAYLGPGGSTGSGSTGGGGGGTGDGGSPWWKHVQWGDVAKTGLPLLGSLFAPTLGGDISRDVSTLRTQSNQLFGQGRQYAQTGMDSVAQVMGYLQTLLTGDQAAVSAALAPERARVIDQYDSAKKAAEFSPRSATAGARLSLANQQAQQLALLPLAARQGAAQALGQIGTQAAQTGLSAESAAQQSLAQVLYPLLYQRNMNQGAIHGVFEALGQLIGPLLTAAVV